MRRVVLVLAVLALALPMAAWANTISVTNQNGLVLVSGMAGTNGAGTIGLSTIASHSSVLTSFDGMTSTLGRVIFSTGALMSGSVVSGGTFSGTGSSFEVVAFGAWLSGLGLSSKTVALFNGTFNGPITWTDMGTVGNTTYYQLTGYITGTLWNGQTVTGYTTQQMYAIGGKMYQGLGHISFGNTNLGQVPEPGTLGLLGTGLVGLAGIFRRKLMRS